MTDIASSILQVQERIRRALERAGRPLDSARLLAVSKTFPVADIRLAHDAGLRAFGENRPQELAEKTPLLPDDIEWHLIGHLQANKVRLAVRHAACIHSIDSPELLERLQRIAAEENKATPFLVEVNVSGEASKFGVRPEQAEALLAGDALKGPATPVGLMTVAPADASERDLHRLFASLRTLRDQLQQRLGLRLPELSMGMSHDFEIALAEGATIVRVGSAIFGGRAYPQPEQH